MDIIEREVMFEKYCSKCKYSGLAEHKDPCNECLDQPFNEQTDKPVKFDAK